MLALWIEYSIRYAGRMRFFETMQSHSAGNIPEWANTTTQLNMFQEIAELTAGIATPGNALTAVGLAANIEACRILRSGNVREGTLSGHDLVRACALLAIDGFSDNLDGTVARATKTRSPLGRRLDAGTDAFRTLNSFHALWQSGVMPGEVALALGLEKTATIVPSLIANIRGNEPVITSAGKAITAVQRSTGGFYLLSAMFEQLAHEEIQNIHRKGRHEKFAEYAHWLALTAFASSVALTIPAVVPYVKAATGAPQKHRQAA